MKRGTAATKNFSLARTMSVATAPSCEPCGGRCRRRRRCRNRRSLSDWPPHDKLLLAQEPTRRCRRCRQRSTTAVEDRREARAAVEKASGGGSEFSLFRFTFFFAIACRRSAARSPRLAQLAAVVAVVVASVAAVCVYCGWGSGGDDGDGQRPFCESTRARAFGAYNFGRVMRPKIEGKCWPKVGAKCERRPSALLALFAC